MALLCRLEDRIRELCSRTVVARGPEWDAVLEELKAALNEHTKKFKDAPKPLKRADDFPQERRLS